MVVCNAEVASSFSPAEIAFKTFFILVRSRDLLPALCFLRLSACLARFLDWFELANYYSLKIILTVLVD